MILALFAMILNAAVGFQSPDGHLSLHVSPWRGAPVAGSVPHSRRYEVLTKGAPGSSVRLYVEHLPEGWVGSFCTARICSPFRVSVAIGRNGVTRTEFQVVPDDARTATTVSLRMVAAVGSKRFGSGFLSSPKDVSLAPAPGAASPPALRPVLTAPQWLNGTPHSVRGKVVLLDVFTFDCINCKHIVPELRALYRDRAAADFQIIGIHSPETPYEKIRSNVIANLARQGIVWPVAIDNDFALWNAYNVNAWPTQLLFDRRGNLRYTFVGEGQDPAVADAVSLLVRERGGSVSRTKR